MASRILRTIGSLIVLGGVGVAAVIQVGVNAQEEPAELVATAEPGTTEALDPTTSENPATTESTPTEPQFTYRLGVLSGVSTQNFWAFYGEQPNVWNSYILGPTRPVLMAADPTTRALSDELMAGSDIPRWDETGWHVHVELRDDFYWSDGEPVTAHDMSYTFDVVRELELGGSWLEVFPSQVEDVEATDDFALTIHFTGRPTLSVWPHSVGQAPIMASHVWEPITSGSDRMSLYTTAPASEVGGGPLALLEASPDLVTSVRNPGYPNPIAPSIVEYHVFDTESEMVAAIAGGQIDSVLTPKGLTPQSIDLIADNPAISVTSSQAHGVRYLGFNLDRAPMSDPSFRTALALLIDREEMAHIAEVAADPATSFVPEENTGWYEQDSALTIADSYSGSLQERLARALQGLAESGYEWDTPPGMLDDGSIAAGQGLRINGVAPQPLTILTPGDAYDPSRPEYVRGIADTLAWLGFDARPVETDFDTVVDLAFTPDDEGNYQYDMYMLGWTLGSPALPAYYRPLFAADGALNNTGYASAQFIEALKEYETAFTAAEALEAVWAMESILATDLPYLLLYRSQIVEIYRNDRISFGIETTLGGIQGRLGGIEDVASEG